MLAQVFRKALVLSFLALALGAWFAAAEAAEGPIWQSDYYTAYAQAAEQKKLLLIYFCAGNDNRPCAAFENETLADPQVREQLKSCVCVRLPVDTAVKEADAETRLLAHAAFAEMLERPGVAMVDLAHTDAPYFERVVSVLPFAPEQCLSALEMRALLSLPPGTLTQRTLTYAVRVHTEGPQSASGEQLPMLAGEAEAAAAYQARINLQGHHNWDARFQRINGQLPAGHVAQEVCAESWPGQRMLESAHELVHSWRQSSGHWAAVSRAQPYYAYDMKQGSNGIWYGVGVFGNRGN